MTEAGPFTRLVRVDALPREGQNVIIEANPAEREALASLYELPEIAALTATLRVEPAARGGARVTGTVHGEFTQICVVSLEPFDATVDEAVDVRFAPQEEKDSARKAGRETLTLSLADDDDPDPVIDGRIDLGALAAEFFALGLDPYPRKPGVEFVAPAAQAAPDSPFAALAGKPAKRQRVSAPPRRRAPLKPVGRA
jgi:Large ribosomal RNA subunit accumulation protein YceD